MMHTHFKVDSTNDRSIHNVSELFILLHFINSEIQTILASVNMLSNGEIPAKELSVLVQH